MKKKMGDKKWIIYYNVKRKRFWGPKVIIVPKLLLKPDFIQRR